MPKKKTKVEEETPLTKSINKRLNKAPQHKQFVSTGSPLLDWQLSESIPGGVCTGKVLNIVGGSQTGKSFLANTILAEAANNPEFDDYLFISDDTEFASEFNIEKLFGKRLASRMQPPITPTKENPFGVSQTVEQTYQNILRYLAGNKPFIYVVDSLDDIKSKEDETRAAQFLKKGEADGTYGGGKPKLMSEMLRVVYGDISTTRSIVIFVSQTRDKIGVTFGKKKTKAGGKALDFYCCYILELAHLSAIKTTSDHAISLGSETLVKVEKNKFLGKDKISSKINIYNQFGIDSITPALDFLIKRNAIKKDMREEKGKKIWSKKYIFGDIVELKKEIVTAIWKSKKLYLDLCSMVADEWQKLEAEAYESLSITDRKTRYE